MYRLLSLDWACMYAACFVRVKSVHMYTHLYSLLELRIIVHTYIWYGLRNKTETMFIELSHLVLLLSDDELRYALPLLLCVGLSGEVLLSWSLLRSRCCPSELSLTSLYLLYQTIPCHSVFYWSGRGVDKSKSESYDIYTEESKATTCI